MYYFLLVFIICCRASCNEIFVEDVQKIFGDKHCIEASRVSMRSFDNVNIMVEKESVKNPLKSLLISNVTELANKARESDKSALSKINELAQHNEIEYNYELISKEGPPHKPLFTIRLTLSNEKYEGMGTSLKDAQRAAAALALANTELQHPPIKEKEEKVVLTPTVLLNNIATKVGLPVSYDVITEKDAENQISNYSLSTTLTSTKKTYFQKLNDSIYHPDKGSLRVPTEEAQISGPFTVRVKVGESIFVGFGHTIQSARHDAATKAIKNMEKEILLRNNYCSNEETYELCRENKESVKSPTSRVYEAGQKHKLPVDFELISESGKPHNKLFITRCTLGEYETKGEGKSKKESKRLAAENMLSNLAKLPEIIDGKEVTSDLSAKKKKNKKKKIINAELITTSKDDVITDKDHVNTILDSFWSTTSADNGKTEKGDVSPKDKLLGLGNALKIEIQFTDLSHDQDYFFSMATLGVSPLHLCYGKGVDRDRAQDDAALHSLHFLHKAGLLKAKLHTDTISFSDYEIDEENLVYAEAGQQQIKE